MNASASARSLSREAHRIRSREILPAKLPLIAWAPPNLPPWVPGSDCDITMFTEGPQDVDEVGRPPSARLAQAAPAGLSNSILVVAKSGYDFRRHIELPVNTIRMAGKEMKPLPAHAAFKYLGIRMIALGSTEAERRHVCDTVNLSTRHGGMVERPTPALMAKALVGFL
eukprot:3810347-Rhodomonas_salina.1